MGNVGLKKKASLDYYYSVVMVAGDMSINRH